MGRQLAEFTTSLLRSREGQDHTDQSIHTPGSSDLGVSKDGEYTVRIAYHGIALTGNDENFPESSNRDQTLWNHIWTCRTTPRVRMLCWTFCSDALPCNVRPHHRLHDHYPTCPVCGQDPETEIHIFRDCKETKKVWREMGILIDCTTGEIREWIHRTRDEMNANEFAKFLTTLCSIWDQRNQWVFEGKFKESRVLATALLGLCDELKNPMKTPTPPMAQTDKTWKPLQPGWIKLNSDVTIMEGKGTGLGFCIRDEKGRLLGACMEQGNVCYEPIFAEATAIIRSLQFVRERRFQRVEVETDCLNIIKELKSILGDQNSTLRPFIDDILSLSTTCTEVQRVYIPRVANDVAHELARYELWEVGIRLRVGNIPVFVNKLIAEQAPNI